MKLENETVEQFKMRGGEVKMLRRGDQSYDPSAKWDKKTGKKLAKKEIDLVKNATEGITNE